MLKHSAVIAAVSNCYSIVRAYNVGLSESDALLSYLPLAHIFDRSAGRRLALAAAEWASEGGGGGFFSCLPLMDVLPRFARVPVCATDRRSGPESDSQPNGAACRVCRAVKCAAQTLVVH
eukprot:366518-Chlamydomonas_euryale.AAC.10